MEKGDGMRGNRRPLLGMGLFLLYAAGLLLGIRYGPTAVRVWHLDPAVRPLPILMYHNVVRDGVPCNEMTVTVSRLREDLEYLRQAGYTTVLPRDLLDPDTLPDKPVLLTFDDGYASTYDLLYPLLQAYQDKAAVCPIVAMADWWVPAFCNWFAWREMCASGLVEAGSHTWNLHNPDSDGMFVPDGANGVERKPG